MFMSIMLGLDRGLNRMPLEMSWIPAVAFAIGPRACPSALEKPSPRIGISTRTDSGSGVRGYIIDVLSVMT